MLSSSSIGDLDGGTECVLRQLAGDNKLGQVAPRGGADIYWDLCGLE